jgi:hypothetical protein
MFEKLLSNEKYCYAEGKKYSYSECEIVEEIFPIRSREKAVEIKNRESTLEVVHSDDIYEK